MEISTQKSRRELIILVGVFISSMTFFWHKFSFAILPGDNRDSRLCLMWMEHWYVSLIHFTAPWNLPNFYPTKNTLSGSDAFFLEGMFHSLFRLIGLNISAAFATSIVILHIAGCLSSIFLVRIFKFGIFEASVVVALFGTMSPYWLCRNHVQLMLTPILGWVVYFLVKAAKSERRVFYLTLASIIFWSMLLSSGYAIAFAVFFTIIGLPVAAFFGLIKKEKIKDSVIMWSKPVIFSQIYSSPFILLFIRIYYWHDSIIGRHSKSEILFYSPSITDLVSIPPSSGGIESKIPFLREILFKINNLPNPTGEFGGALTLSTLLILLSFTSYQLYRKKQLTQTNSKTLTQFFNSAYVTLILGYCLILKDFRGFNFWSVTFYHLPFLGSIRVVGRFILFACLLLPFLFAILFGNYISIKKTPIRLAICYLSIVVLFVSQGSQIYGNFKARDLTNSTVIESQIATKCKSFYLLADAGEENSILPDTLPDMALQIAVNSGIPTINGNSSFLPRSFSPALAYENDRKITYSDLHEWINRFNLQNVCLVSLSEKSGSPKFQILEHLSGTIGKTSS